ncbi:hypothetical protein [Blastococcus capsensis]|uniref:hypothetical protein n=1 Tax=Blastococcus capsensis TaxID=1564163 RepID=UPI002540486C|nr:hypothetical protein [Blastococcus capsensis]MDK3254881.1 hypothetical protein [Blastococcus capsensis]
MASSETHADTHGLHRSARATKYSPNLTVDQLLTRGVAAGLTGGQVFIVANMYFAFSQGAPPVAPFLAISTIFRFSDMPMMGPPEVIIGLVTHLTLSILFGIIFALIAPLLRSALALIAGGLVYGLLLYVVNFQVFGRLLFPWFTNPQGPNQILELILHPLAFGLFLVPFFLAVAWPRPGTRTRD